MYLRPHENGIVIPKNDTFKTIYLIFVFKLYIEKVYLVDMISDGSPIVSGSVECCTAFSTWSRGCCAVDRLLDQPATKIRLE